ncbi:MAG TPA: hypothetical protein VJ891_05180 [Casimicrobiaceae bacterium]|nr:hypothetical protein [Casimicrobiaceae bacterium]
MKASVVKWIAWAAPLVAIALVNLHYWRKEDRRAPQANTHRAKATLEVSKKYEPRPKLCAVGLLGLAASRAELAGYERIEHIGWIRLDGDGDVYDVDEIQKLACEAGADWIRPAARSQGKPLFALFRNKTPIGGRVGSPCASPFDCDPILCGASWARVCAKLKSPDGRKATFGLCEADCSHALPSSDEGDGTTL